MLGGVSLKAWGNENGDGRFWGKLASTFGATSPDEVTERLLCRRETGSFKKRKDVHLQWQGRLGGICKFDIIGLIYICLNFLNPCFKTHILGSCSFPTSVLILAQEICSMEWGTFNWQSTLSRTLRFSLTFLAVIGDEKLLNFHGGS